MSENSGTGGRGRAIDENDTHDYGYFRDFGEEARQNGRRVPMRFVAAALLTALVACRPPAAFDLIVRGGSVLDGSGAPPVRADVGIKGDRIAFVGDLSSQSSAREIDASGMTVTPGFIDVQGQSGTTVLADGNAESHVRQGITTEIIGEGSSPAFWSAQDNDAESLRSFGLSVDWTGFDGYFGKVQAAGTAINLGTLVPATAVRQRIVGLENRDPSADELTRMEAMVDQAMRDGAFGLSSALVYPPGSFAKTGELVALARVAARHHGIYVSHIRGESFNLFKALDEALQIGREGGLPVVIFHLKVAARGNWGRMKEVVAKLEAANAETIHVSATMYPYTVGGTRLAASLPLWVQEGGREKMLERLKDPAVRARARTEIETTIDGWENFILASGFDGIQIASVPQTADQSLLGKRISEIARARQQSDWDTFFAVLQETDGRAGALYHMMSEDDVKRGLQWPQVSIGTDSSALRTEGVLGRGSPHPRAYGTFPRVLGKYVREDKVLDLGDAVRRMTSLAARQFGIQNRGLIRPEMYADLVVFDPATIRDNATFEQPHQYPNGIAHVVVNGVPVVDPRGLTGARPGRAVYGPGRTAPTS
jgi:N-acyl-D-aspartate/D-glutamate deacylase